jgi:hypothetical protein
VVVFFTTVFVAAAPLFSVLVWLAVVTAFPPFFTTVVLVLDALVLLESL